MSRSRVAATATSPAAALGVALAAAVTAALLGGCPAKQLVCVDVDPSCTPLYEPTYDNVYAITLSQKCGVSNACHAGARPQAGMDLSDHDGAFDALLDPDRHRVLPGDPRCSEVVERIENDGDFQMPPGDPLDPSERCAIAKWIAAGASKVPPDAGVAADAAVDAGVAPAPAA